MRRREVRIYFNRFAEFFNSSIILARFPVAITQFRSYDWRKRIESLRLFPFDQRFIWTSHVSQEFAIPLMSRRVVGVEFYGSLKFFISSCPIPIVIELHVCQCS